MKAVFVLSGEDMELAAAEVSALLDTEDHKVSGNIMMATLDKKDAARLGGFAKRIAYTRRVSRVLFECDQTGLERSLESFDWSDIEGKSFCVRNFSATITIPESKLAGFVWRGLKEPKVDLNDPEATIELYSFEDKTICAARIFEVDNEFESRKAHLRPCLHPTSMHPKLARALVNLSGIWDGTLVDPFCGSGGIMIEAGLIGFYAEGYDIDKAVLDKARINIAHFGVSDFSLEQKDALTIRKDMEFIATDLPYGLNTKAAGLDGLYAAFMKVLESYLTGRAVIVFPDFYDHRRILEGADLLIRGEYSHYLHKSLSKVIVVLEKRKKGKQVSIALSS